MEIFVLVVLCFLLTLYADKDVHLAVVDTGVTKIPFLRDTTTKDFWSMYSPLEPSRDVGDTLNNDKGHSNFINPTKIEDKLINYLGGRIESNTTKQFLESFTTDLEKEMISKHLQHCPYVPLCSFSLNISLDAVTSCCQMCTCEDYCVEFDNCCPDILISNNIIPKVHVMESKCMPLNLKSNMKSSPFAGKLVYQIATCPKVYKNETIKEMCESDLPIMLTHLSDYVPILDKTSGLVYRNIHCAKCNNINPNDYDMFESQLGCKQDLIFPSSEQGLIKSVYEGSDCDIKFYSDFIQLEQCIPVISECNITGRWQYFNEHYNTACGKYSSIVIGEDGVQYRNIFCALCNDVNVPQTCEDVEKRRTFETQFAVSAVLNITLEEPTPGPLCKTTHIYSDRLKECIRVRCPLWHVVKNNRCRKLFKTTRYQHYSVIYHLRPFSDISLQEAYIKTDKVVTSLYEYMHFKLARQHNKVTVSSLVILLKSSMLYSNAVQSTEILGASIIGMYIYFKVSVHGDHNIELIESLISIKDAVVVENTIFETTLFSGNEEDFKVAASISNIRHVKRYDDMSKTKLHMVSRVFKSANDGLLTVLYTGEMTFKEMPSLPLDTVRITQFSLCPLVQIDNEKHPWERASNSITFLYTNITIVTSNIFFKNLGGIYICLDRYVDIFSGRKTYEARINDNKSLDGIISFILIIVSLMSTLITILAFTLFAKLCSLYVRAIISLSVYLVIAQGIYLTKHGLNITEKSFECDIIGVLCHFLTLLNVFWVQVCGVYVVLVEYRPFAPYSHIQFALCNVYCIIMATLGVVGNFTAEFLLESERSSGYGKDYCFIRSQDMYIFSLLAPVAFVFISNVCCFCIIVCFAENWKKNNEAHLNAKYEIIVLLIMSILIGSTWSCRYFYMFSSFGTLFKNSFVYLYSGHGVYIMIAYVCRVRLFKRIKSKFADSDLKSIQSNAC